MKLCQQLGQEGYSYFAYTAHLMDFQEMINATVVNISILYMSIASWLNRHQVHFTWLLLQF